MKLDLHPRKRIGDITLGMNREDVRSVMNVAGHPLSLEKKKMDYFLDNAIQTEYEDDGTVSFIGVASDARIELHYKGINLFDITAEESFALLAASESGCHEFSAYEYVFPDQIVTLWEADSQYDYRGGEVRVVWGQIGIGDIRYLESIRNLKAKKTEPTG